MAIPSGSDFPLENLPYGVFEARDGRGHIGVAIGDRIFDLRTAAEAGLLENVGDRASYSAGSLNPILEAGPELWRALRERLADLLARDGDPVLRNLNVARFFVDQCSARMRVPVEIGDYIDFYSSEQHATNLGKMFRPNAEPLLPNWKWMPIGYHGRAGSIVIDATPVSRPCGQRKPASAAIPVWGASTMLDFELEIGFLTGRAAIFGVVLVNDWSARDIQAWEYQPLGPFLGKSFATTVSPWIVTMDALAPFRVAPPEQDPQPLSYLRIPGDANYDINLEVKLETEEMRRRGMGPIGIARTNAGGLYWTFEQQLAHARSNGAKIRPGDLFASGTISGSASGSYGSMIELTWGGSKPITLPSGERRSFLEDGDEVTLHGWCERRGLRIGFGVCRGRVAPAQICAGSATQER